MVAWGNHVRAGEIVWLVGRDKVHGGARDPPERVAQSGGGPDVVLQGEHRPRQESAQGAAVPPPAFDGRCRARSRAISRTHVAVPAKYAFLEFRLFACLGSD